MEDPVEDIGDAYARASAALAIEFDVAPRELLGEIARRSQEGTLRETPLVSRWLQLYSALEEPAPE